MINLFLSPTKSMSFRIIWILFMIPSCVFSADEIHKLCSTSFSCGDQSNLFYPFWVPSREDCGHPDFKLDCSGGFAELNISSVNYRILSMSYGSQIIKLARSNYIDNLCPQDPLNAPFNESVLQLAPDTHLLTLYYDCGNIAPPTSASSYFGALGCGDDGSYYVPRNLSSPVPPKIAGFLNSFMVTCKRNVSILASGPSLDTLQNIMTQDNLKKALKDGFELGVNQECSMCMYSEGACGYNKSSGGFTCYCIDGRQNSTCGSRHKGLSDGAKAGIGAASGFAVAILIAEVLFCLISRRRRTSDDRRQENMKALIPLKHYSYAQVKKMTKSFTQVVGKGGFGTVYRGTLCDGHCVAVKVLKDSKSNGEDFINEVASMSKTSHVNIVDLLGFCSQGSKKAIIYEFLENGSLDRFISRSTSMNLDWTILYNISLGIARGLEYLHPSCKERNHRMYC